MSHHASDAIQPETAPIVGIGCQLYEGRIRVRQDYLDAVTRAGGVPLLLGPVEIDAADAVIRASLDRCHALVLTGGDDPAVERYGDTTHPAVTLEDPRRQHFDERLLAIRASEFPEMPLLAVCLGMQLLALARGGSLNQHLPDDTPTHADHANNATHAIVPTTDHLGGGTVTSSHHQAVRDAGDLDVIARAHDGVIEAIADSDHAYCLGVQWHPERTSDPVLGQSVFDDLIDAARRYSAAIPTPEHPTPWPTS